MKQQQNKLRFERKRLGWSQEDVAVKINSHEKTIGRWERGISIPSPYYQQRLAALFGKSVQELGLLSTPEEEDKDYQLHTGPLQEDWREAPATGHFYGREEELTVLEQQVLGESTSIALVCGIGGIGKTSLIMMLAKKIRTSFSSVFWYSLQTAPPFTELLARYVQFISPRQHIDLLEEPNDQIDLFMACLQKQRSLFILDNFESVLQGGSHAGKYREGYDSYGLLLQRVAKGGHQSCFLLTSREKPRRFSQLEGHSSSAFSLYLHGITITEGRKILAGQGLVGSDVAWTNLVHLYSGNPLALKLISRHVRDIFGGDIAAFLGAEKAVFGDIYDLIEQQFQRLSELEQEVIYWLAIEQQSVLVNDLWDNMVHRVSKSLLLETLGSLHRRSMIEIGYGGRCSLQPVIAEYITERLTKQIYQELATEEMKFLQTLALTRAQAREDVKNSQARLIFTPIVAMLNATIGEQEGEKKLRAILALLRTTNSPVRGYAGSNLLHLLIFMRANLRGIDCSHLVIQQAYLRGVDLPEVNFSHAELIQSVFTDTFGGVFCVAFNDDGSLFAMGTTNGEVRLWRTSSFEPLFTCQGHTDGVRSIAFSPDGKLIASGSADQTVRLWDTQVGQCQQILYGHSGPVRSVTFHPDRQRLASCGEDMSLRIWQIDSGKSLKEFHGHTGWIRSITFSPDGAMLVSGGDDGSVRIWEADSGRSVNILQGHVGRVRSVAFSSDGSLVASGGDDQIIRLWDAHNGQLLHALEGPLAFVRSVTFSADSRLLAAGGDDQMVYLWETSTRRHLSTLQGHTNRIWSVAFTPDGQFLLSGSEDQTVRLWDIETGHCQYTLQGYSGLIWSVVFSPDDALLVSSGDDGLIRIWETNSGRCLKILRGHTHRVRCTAFSPDGTILASGSDDKTIRLWDVSTAQCFNILRGHTHLVRSLAYHPDGNLLVSGSHDKSIQFWDVNTGRALRTLQGCNSLVWAVAFSPDGRLVVSSSDDKIVRIWEASSGSCQANLQGHTHRVWSAAFSPDGLLVASGSDDQTIRLWQVSDGECLTILEGHTHWVRSLAFSPDGKTIVSGSHDTTVRLWEVSTGRCIAIFREHRSWIWSVAFSVDGKHVASSSDDGIIKLWDRETGKCLKTLISERPYEGMNITGVKGLNEMQKATLKTLGAVVDAD